jgi:sugar phosphate isomerase/epimerase
MAASDPVRRRLLPRSREISVFKNLNPAALGVSGHQSEIIELVLTYGFRGMDVDIAELSARVKLHGAPYARRLIDSAGIRIGAFALPVDVDADEELFAKQVAKLAEYAQVAGEFGCTRCLTTLAPASERLPYHENFEFVRRRLSEICKALEPAGIRLGVGFRASESLRKGQTFQFIHDLDALSRLLSMVGAANIGVLVDIWDIVVAGGSIDTVRAIPARQIIAVRLADLPADIKPAEATEQVRLLPGTPGQIDFVALLTMLSEMGYDGPITPMPDRKALDGSRRDRIVKQAGDALDKMWRAAGLVSVAKVHAAAH